MRDAYLAKSGLMHMLQIGVADTESGTLFGGQHRREFQKSRLTLVIAAGGSGITAIRQAMAAVNRKLDQDYSSYVKFLAIDSWEHDLEYVKKSGGDTLNITSPMAVMRFTRDRRSDFYRRFISADFPVFDMGDGGYGRQLNKVRLYDLNRGTTNDQLLIDMISEYFTGDWAAHKDLPVDILIVSGLGGNMGSGTFIDIAVRARQACPIPANVTVYGYLMLPDTIEKFAPDDSGRGRIYSNGFAALKELESYESILFEKDRKEFFPAPWDKNNVVITEPIFDYPVLISGDYDKAIDLVTDAIVMTVADSSGKSVLNSLYGQRQAARQIKLAKDKVSRLGILNPDACPEESHMYCSFGHARASIPEKIVNPRVIEALPEERQQIEINKAVDLIFEQLMMNSKPCLKVKKGTEQICSGAILIPGHLCEGAAGRMIWSAFHNKIISTKRVSLDLVFSYDADSIECCQISLADALSDLEDLDKWEDAYEDSVDSVTHLHNGELPTLHMETGYSQYNELTMKETAREKHLTGEMPILPHYKARPDAEEWLNRIYGTGLAWKHYPSINAARYGNSFDGNGDTGEADYRSGLFTEKINEAMRVGVIECVREGNTYKYFINLIPRDWTNLRIRGYKNRYKNGLFVRGKELFDFLANQNREVATDYRKQIFLSDSEFFGKDGFDFTEAIRVHGWNQERIDREHKAYMMRVMRKSTGLYQEMEDTMWRLYPIEYELEK